MRADFYVAALPVEIMHELLTRTTPRRAAAAGLDRLVTRWMNPEFLLYLRDDLPLVRGHAIYFLDSGEALTSISQQPVSGTGCAAAGRGRAVDRHLGMAAAPGGYREGRGARTPEEIRAPRCGAQLRCAHSRRRRWTVWRSSRVFLDEAIRSSPNPSGAINADPLLVNTT